MTESGSSIQTFLTCPKLYWFKYVKLLESRTYSSALGFGIFFHAQVEAFASGRGDAPVVELGRMMENRAQEYKDQIAIDFEQAYQFFRLWKANWEKDHPHANKNFEFIASEKEWGFNVNECGDRHLGKSDGVVRHLPTRAVFLYELKSAADRDREGYVHKLELDRQVSSNILALKRDGVDVQGVVYDIAWKPGIRRLTGRKTKPDETPQEFSDRLVAAAAEAEDTFERHIVYRSDRLLAEHERDLGLQFDMIARAHEKGFTRNTNSCFNYSTKCPYYSACIEGREELLELYSVRDRKHPELSKEIQANATA